jgi:hypothetical protein
MGLRESAEFPTSVKDVLAMFVHLLGDVLSLGAVDKHGHPQRELAPGLADAHG